MILITPSITPEQKNYLLFKITKNVIRYIVKYNLGKILNVMDHNLDMNSKVQCTIC